MQQLVYDRYEIRQDGVIVPASSKVKSGFVFKSSPDNTEWMAHVTPSAAASKDWDTKDRQAIANAISSYAAIRDADDAAVWVHDFGLPVPCANVHMMVQSAAAVRWIQKISGACARRDGARLREWFLDLGLKVGWRIPIAKWSEHVTEMMLVRSVTEGADSPAHRGCYPFYRFTGLPESFSLIPAEGYSSIRAEDMIACCFELPSSTDQLIAAAKEQALEILSTVVNRLQVDYAWTTNAAGKLVPIRVIAPVTCIEAMVLELFEMLTGAGGMDQCAYCNSFFSKNRRDQMYCTKSCKVQSGKKGMTRTKR